jgi:riboflavin biosynthesis pyrimidine reductase
MGDNTLRVEPDHIWSAEFLWPDDSEAFASLRADEARAAMPLQVFLSLDCDIDVPSAAVFACEDARIVLATTSRGASRARRLSFGRARVDVLALGKEAVDPAVLLDILGKDYGVRTVLCEGGPRAYASLLAVGCVDDEFLALSPTVVGAAPGSPRPSLVEGVAFTHDRHPRSLPLTLHRAGDMLFLRARYVYPA